MLYMISYDLRRQGQNYDAMIARCVELGASKVLYSQWLLPHDATASDVYSLVSARGSGVDGNDGLLISEITKRTIWNKDGLEISGDELRALLQYARP